jgi:hypothetical protein
MLEFPREDEETVITDSFLSASPPYHFQQSLVWIYSEYLHTLKFSSHHSRDDRRRIHHQAKNYLIIGDTLYHRGVDSVLSCYLTHEKWSPCLMIVHWSMWKSSIWVGYSPKNLVHWVLLADNI